MNNLLKEGGAQVLVHKIPCSRICRPYEVSWVQIYATLYWTGHVDISAAKASRLISFFQWNFSDAPKTLKKKFVPYKHASDYAIQLCRLGAFINENYEFIIRIPVIAHSYGRNLFCACRKVLRLDLGFFIIHITSKLKCTKEKWRTSSFQKQGCTPKLDLSENENHQNRHATTAKRRRKRKQKYFCQNQNGMTEIKTENHRSTKPFHFAELYILTQMFNIRHCRWFFCDYREPHYMSLRWGHCCKIRE